MKSELISRPDTELYLPDAVSIYDRFPAPNFEQVLRLIRLTKPEKGFAYDVGCGTGTLVQYLRNEGWTAFGCDPSPFMVKKACEKLGDGAVQFASATSFEPHQQSDLITSTFDVMNHLPDFDHVRAFFKRSYRLLNRKGVLIFDTVTPSDINKNWPRYAQVESLEKELIAIRGECIGDGIGRLYYDFFLKATDGGYRRTVEIHTLRSLSLRPTLRALKETGFVDVVRLDAMTLLRASNKTVRWIFVARKP